MAVSVIVGSQWGDEGKGKIVDMLSARADYVARYQGGANAGHTIVINGKQFVLHLVPAGILTKGVRCVIGNGVVVDPVSLLEELDMLTQAGIDFSGRLFISTKAHLILPYHKVIDKASETKKAKDAVGTTGRGIGPAYIDKYKRCGVRAQDLLNRDVLIKKITANVEENQALLNSTYNGEKLNLQEIIDSTLAIVEKVRPFITDTEYLLNDAIRAGKELLFEGAQGALLDVDHGTFPFVTSSNPISGGACTGLGVAPVAIDNVIGVVKAYCTRVGNGPFPTELHDDMGEQLRHEGHEFGATTGRPRRCGWLDMVALNYSVMINGIKEIALTKIDVLNTLDEIKVCTGYKINGKITNRFTSEIEALENAIPVYETFPGWKKDLAGITDFEKLPESARNYINAIEKMTGAKVKYISVSPSREDTIVR
jgi:adenylosuccinate synthase